MVAEVRAHVTNTQTSTAGLQVLWMRVRCFVEGSHLGNGNQLLTRSVFLYEWLYKSFGLKRGITKLKNSYAVLRVPTTMPFALK